ncbi:MAG: MutS-related protein [Candidatus Cyclobacteriaceae bacterium M3_2C_046]
MKNAPQEVFKNNVVQFRQREDYYTSKSSLYSTIRTILFIVFLIGLIFFANEKILSMVLVLLLIFPLIFGLLIRFHNQINFKRDHARYLKEINQEELDRLEMKLKLFDQGLDFQDHLHPYSGDLDIFGSHSLFQLINHTNTSSGRKALANYLLNPGQFKFIKDQQQAVLELGQDFSWLQEFQALGRHHKHEKSHIDILKKWILERNQIHKRWMYQILQLVMPLIIIVMLVLFFIGGLSLTLLLPPFIFNFYLLYRVSPYAKSTYDQTYNSIRELKVFEALIKAIEQREFKAERLKHQKSFFQNPDIMASQSIKKLKNILDGLESRHNLFYQSLNIVFLLDYFWLIRAERWKEKNKEYALNWFSAIGEVEVINSLAGFGFAHPEYVMPTITQASHVLQSTSLGHPLIHSEARVNNDFQYTKEKQITIVTGSNMSGKSTFLRTVGINTVLALMGAPVCASSMEVSVCQIFTSMRNQDNLEENISSFYAELKRIRQLLDLIQSSPLPVLFMLDEILKGTNSKDRHQGATALIKQLAGLPAAGFVSTHDLELGELVKEMASVKNYSFESSIDQGELFFDYKIHEGITESFNASILMAKIGIDMNKA